MASDSCHSNQKITNGFEERIVTLKVKLILQQKVLYNS